MCAINHSSNPCIRDLRQGLSHRFYGFVLFFLHDFLFLLVSFTSCPSSRVNCLNNTYVLQGIQFGFRLGFQPERASLHSCTANLRSADQHATIVDQYLATELREHRVAGPFVDPSLLNLHIIPFGVLLKQHQPGKWSLILDLSSPSGHSVNDAIPKDKFSLRYITVDDAIAALLAPGHGAQLAKFDIKAAYRNIPVSSHDRFLLGMKWRQSFTWILLCHLVCGRLLLFLIPLPLR